MPNAVAVVTGGGSGIGRAVALALLGGGFDVIVAGRRPGALAETVGLAPAQGGRALAVPADVADPASVRALFARVHADFGRLDLLFNNAGVNAPGVSLEDVPYEKLRAVVDTNVVGAYLCTQEAFRLMKAQTPRGGRIINNGSISAHAPRPGSSAYTVAKHAITGLTKTASLDGRPYDIACGQIDLGNTQSDMASRTMAHGLRQPDGSVRIEPLMDVRHVADAVLYMARLPLDANVQFMTVMPTKMPFIGRG